MKINCDLGEGLDDIDALLIPLIDQASIACGAHAGNHASITHCIQLAKQHQTEIGIHPSYPDRENFGRVSLNISRTALARSLTTQILSFLAVCESENVQAEYIKPHGALYNDLAKDEELLVFFLQLIEDLNKNSQFNKPLAAMLSSKLYHKATQNLASKLNVSIIFEAFADRAYNRDGSLVLRTDKRALHTAPEKIVAQFSSLALKGGVTTIEGEWLALHADSICVHGDNPAVSQAICEIRGQFN